MDADLHAILGIAKLDARMRTPALIQSVLSRQFVDAHPTLVRMLHTPHLRLDVVQSMIEHLTAVRTGEQGVHDASVAVGQALVDAYVVSGNRSQHASD